MLHRMELAQDDMVRGLVCVLLSDWHLRPMRAVAAAAAAAAPPFLVRCSIMACGSAQFDVDKAVTAAAAAAAAGMARTCALASTCPKWSWRLPSQVGLQLMLPKTPRLPS